MPRRAVMQGANDFFVYVVQPDDTVERRTVEIAASQEGVAVIGKGLEAGTKVVVDGQYRLTDGAAIRIDAPEADRPPAVAQPQDSHNEG